MENPFKLNDITEEQILKVIKYFDTYKNGHWDTSWESECQIRIWYWILHERWDLTIDIAEQERAKDRKRDQESYRWNKEQEINNHLKAYRQEKAGDTGIYELMRLNEWEDWRTMVIGFMEKFDDQLGKYKWSHAVEIEERCNPEYFQEIAKRFKLVID